MARSTPRGRRLARAQHPFRTRAVKNDTRQEVRAKEEQLKKLQAEIQRLQKEIAVQGEDLKYLQKLEGFTGTGSRA